MEDTLTFFVTIIFAVLLLIFMPLFNLFERQDDMAYEFVLSATTSLCDDVMRSGALTRERYNAYINELDATGNTYKIDLEADKKMYNRLNEHEVILNYFKDYTRQIIEQVESPYINNPTSNIKSAAYLLDKGDYFFMKVRNTNITQATIFFSALGGKRDYVKIRVDYGGIVRANEWQDPQET